jgi:hypothetical protein
MRRVILLTGALRTIRKTMKYLKRNVLCGYNGVQSKRDLDIFACVQNDSSLSEEEWTLWFRSELGDQLVSITWFSLDRYPAWVAHRDLQLEHLTIDEGWKGYLRNSGSMIEYFQLQLVYMKMCQVEEKEGFRYDYVIRARTDSIYAKPVDFHWLSWSEEDVERRLAKIKEEMRESKMEITARDIFRYFMCTIISDDLIPNLSFLSAEYVPCPTDSNHIPESAKQIMDFIHEGRYILTIRKNNLYVVRRDLFHLIPTLGTMYGFMRSPIADGYWFNAEGQFRDACYYSCLSIFEYSTVYPHQWNEADFFDLNFECIHPRMLYCVVRK